MGKKSRQKREKLESQKAMKTNQLAGPNQGSNQELQYSKYYRFISFLVVIRYNLYLGRISRKC